MEKTLGLTRPPSQPGTELLYSRRRSLSPGLHVGDSHDSLGQPSSKAQACTSGTVKAWRGMVLGHFVLPIPKASHLWLGELPRNHFSKEPRWMSPALLVSTMVLNACSFYT